MHKRLNELRELVQYYEQTSDMMVDTVNENVKEEEDDDEEDGTEDGSLFDAMFDSEQENRRLIANIGYNIYIGCGETMASGCLKGGFQMTSSGSRSHMSAPYCDPIVLVI